MEYRINVGECTVPIDIKKVEELKNATYVGDFCIRTKSGNWSESPVAVFHVENPPEGFGHYFGMFMSVLDDRLMITDASSAFEKPISGIASSTGEVIYSRYRHDFRSLPNGEGSIDGGRDYAKIVAGKNGFPTTCEIGIEGAKLFVKSVKVLAKPVHSKE
jgi:hypothetical protein